MIDMEDLPYPFPADLRAISLASLFGLDHLERNGLEDYLREARSKGILVFADTIYDKFGIGLKGVYICSLRSITSFPAVMRLQH